jgi:formylglycine-generating enzyme required for sulfatase activity
MSDPPPPGPTTAAPVPVAADPAVVPGHADPVPAVSPGPVADPVPAAGGPAVSPGPVADPVPVPLGPGTVTLSDRRTQRSWQVSLRRYLLDPVPVTQRRYAAVTGAAPSAVDDPDRPVDGVSWWDAVRFCNAYSQRAGLTPVYRIDGDAVATDAAADGYRLPTEAEWEYACRAGSTGPRYGELDEIAWYRGNSGGHSHPVGTRAANAWGLSDLLGNVWEWCADHYDPQVYGSYRVLRGGGWADEQWSCRASVRRRSHPTFRIDDVGFRLARSIPP